MSDLVERLRSSEVVQRPLRDAAADEIERLEGLIREDRDAHDVSLKRVAELEAAEQKWTEDGLRCIGLGGELDDANKRIDALKSRVAELEAAVNKAQAVQITWGDRVFYLKDDMWRVNDSDGDREWEGASNRDVAMNAEIERLEAVAVKMRQQLIEQRGKTWRCHEANQRLQSRVAELETKLAMAEKYIQKEFRGQYEREAAQAEGGDE